MPPKNICTTQLQKERMLLDCTPKWVISGARLCAKAKLIVLWHNFLYAEIFTCYCTSCNNYHDNYPGQSVRATWYNECWVESVKKNFCLTWIALPLDRQSVLIVPVFKRRKQDGKAHFQKQQKVVSTAPIAWILWAEATQHLLGLIPCTCLL